MGALLPKQTYIRLLFLMTALILCAAACFSVFLSQKFSAYAIEEIAKVNKREIHHTAVDIEALAQKLKSYAVTIYADPEINAWISSGKDDPIVFVSAANRLTKLISAESFIDNVYLMNRRKRQIYETRYGLRAYETFDGQEALGFFEENQPALNFFCFEAEGKRYFTLKVPSTPVKLDGAGYIALTMNLNLFQERFLNKNSEEDGDTRTLLFVEGEAVFAAGWEDAAQLAALLELRGPAPQGSFTVSLGGLRWLAHYDTVESQQWTVFRLINLEDINLKIHRFRNTLLASFFGLLCVLLGFLYWYSHRALKPLSRLADKIQGLLGQEVALGPEGHPRGAPREYTVIERSIDALHGKFTVLDNSIRAHKDLIKEDALRQWILQGKLNAISREYLCAETRLLETEAVYLAVFRLEAYQRLRARHDFIELKQMKYALGLEAQHILAEAGFAAETADMGTDCVVAVIAGGPAATDRLKTLLERMHGLARPQVPTGLAVALGFACGLDWDLKKTYANLYETSMLKFIWGQEKVYDEGDFEAYVSVAPILPEDACLDAIIQAVRIGNLEKAFCDFNGLLSQLRTMTYGDCQAYLTLYIYLIFKAFSKHAPCSDFIGVGNRLKDFTSLEAASEWIKAEIRRIAESIASGHKSGKRKEKVLEIVEYVENNLHNPLLTLDDVADHVAFSPRYVRQIFKDTFEQTLSDYILEKRIEKVRRLLETTRCPVGDIVEQTGFLSKSHFFTAFKKATGLTPSQYRQDIQGT